MKLGLYCEDGGAEFEPYLFAKQMIENAPNQNALFEHTEIDSITKTEQGFIATTNYHNKIKCKKIIFACGYNFELLPEISLCELDVSYSIVTKPIKDFKIYKNALVQDDKSPYHYLRLLPDNRIIFGGEDTAFKNGINPKTAERKYNKLYKELCKLFPQYSEDLIVDYKFCGAFGSTDNNLGLIGEAEPNIYYMISCGANGIINAMCGVDILADAISGKTHPLAHLFSPKR